MSHAAGRPVRRIRLRVGHLRQVVPDTLDYCWQISTAGTELDGCVLDVDYVPATVACASCDATTELTLPVLRCGVCGGVEVRLVQGEEFLIESIDVAEEVC